MSLVLAELAAAIAFLTRIPVPSARPVGGEAGRSGAAAFGLIGAGIGAIAAIPILALGERAPIAAAALAVAVMALLSGGLHLDGLGDTADALAAPTAAAANRARKDPAVGAAGVAAIAITIAVQVGLLSSMVIGTGPAFGPGIAAVALIVAAGGSRALPVVAVALLGRRRWSGLAGSVGAGAELGGGLGAWFAARVGAASAVIAGGSAVAVAALASVANGRPSFAVGLVGGVAIGVLLAAWLAATRGALDGDAHGALVELGFAAILLVTLIAS